MHVARSDGLAGADPANLARQRALVESLGGTYHQVVGDDIPTALLDFARGGQRHPARARRVSRRGRLAQLLSRGVGVTTTAESGPIDVHLVTHEEVKRGRSPAAAHAAALTARAGGWPGSSSAAGRAAAADAGARRRCAATCRLTSDILLFLGRGGRGRAGRRPATRRCSPRVAGFAAAQLLLHPAAAPVHHRRAREPARPAASSCSSRSAVSTVVDLAARRTRRGGAGPRRGRDAVHPGRQRAARRAAAARAARPAARDVRPDQRHPARTARPTRASTPDMQHDPDAWRVAASVGDAAVRAPRPKATSRCRSTTTLSLVLRGHVLAAGRPAGPRGVRRPGRGRAAPGAAGRAGRRGRPAGRGRPAAHRAALRGQPRPAHPARLGQGGRRRACAAPTSTFSDRGPGGAARHRRGVARPARSGWSRTCST